MLKKARLHELIALYYEDKASTEEQKELHSLLEAGISIDEADIVLKELWLQVTPDPVITTNDSIVLADNVWSCDHEQISEINEPVIVHRIHFLRTAWFRVAVAILLFIGVGAYIWNTQQKESTIAKKKPAVIMHDILPGTEKAILTLSNGKHVELNSAGSEIISDQTLSIENNNGQLIYKSNDLVAINTMTTPKGGRYQLTLADGTKVWLNAASSITYPTAFTGKNREVNITGEAYFEVQANKAKPFIVKTTTDQITVLGTSFNINAYADEVGVRTSLIEGVVRIGDTNIRPGEAYQQGKLTVTNVKQDIAWKNGYFDFENMNWESALRQLARWYDIDVKITGTLPSSKLKGELGRDLTLSQVLSTLEEIGIKTQLNGNTLTVLP